MLELSLSILVIGGILCLIIALARAFLPLLIKVGRFVLYVFPITFCFVLGITESGLMIPFYIAGIFYYMFLYKHNVRFL